MDRILRLLTRREKKKKEVKEFFLKPHKKVKERKNAWDLKVHPQCGSREYVFLKSMCVCVSAQRKAINSEGGLICTIALNCRAFAFLARATLKLY